MVNIIRYVSIKVKNNENENDNEEKEEIIETCPECKSKNLKKDFHIQETYCAECGLVVKSWEMISIIDIENMILEREKKYRIKRQRKRFSYKKNFLKKRL